MKRIIKIEITKEEAIEAYRKLNKIPKEEEITIQPSLAGGGLHGYSGTTEINYPPLNPNFPNTPSVFC